MTTERPSEETDAHTALLATRWGKVVVSLLVATMAVWVVAPNMPAGPARDTLDVVWSPAIDAGLEQNWAVFSPNPRGQSIEVIAVLEYADGTMAIWSVPDLDPVVGAYRSYRWRKWQERVRLDVNSHFWDASAAWIADHNRRDGQLPRTVRLIRRWTNHAPLTADGAVDDGVNEFEFHVWASDR